MAQSLRAESQKQYWQVKSKYRDTIIFFKVGKFYELYEVGFGSCPRYVRKDGWHQRRRLYIGMMPHPSMQHSPSSTCGGP